MPKVKFTYFKIIFANRLKFNDVVNYAKCLHWLNVNILDSMENFDDFRFIVQYLSSKTYANKCLHGKNFQN